MANWNLKPNQSDPIPAGTVVTVSARPDPDPDPGLPQADIESQYSFTWSVSGPRHDSPREPLLGSGMIVDWDTAGLRAGSYRITVEVAPLVPAGTGAGGSGSGGGGVVTGATTTPS